MTTFPRSPRILRGSFSIYPDDSPGTQAQTINFQYNPGEIRRTLAHRRPQQQQGQNNTTPQDARLVAGPPTETISLSIELDAADQLEKPGDNRDTVESGLNLTLSALEMLMYPPTASYERIQQQAEQGRITVEPGNVPLVLLNWGDSRIVPVLITSFTINEQEFDNKLNPIRAKVDLALQVLTYLDLTAGSSGIDAFVSYQKEKERLANR
ncbi:MAG: hypothetical protein IAE80_01210, partial [Anaerolinea sp.]|nr:hypothetical protein [Anaerolinea sp.]